MVTSTKMTIAEFYNTVDRSNGIYNVLSVDTLKSISVDSLENKLADVAKAIEFFDDVFQLIEIAKFCGIDVHLAREYHYAGYPSYSLSDRSLIIQKELEYCNVFQSLDMEINEENYIGVYSMMQEKLREYYEKLQERLVFIQTTRLP